MVEPMKLPEAKTAIEKDEAISETDKAISELPYTYGKIDLTELVRTCVCCEFNFVQDFKETLQCICPNCRRKLDEVGSAEPISSDIKVKQLPTYPSLDMVLESLRKS